MKDLEVQFPHILGILKQQLYVMMQQMLNLLRTSNIGYRKLEKKEEPMFQVYQLPIKLILKNKG